MSDTREQIRDEIRDSYLHNMAAIVGDSTDEAITPCAHLVQMVIDRCEGPLLPLPDESVGISAASRGTQRED